MAAFYKAPCSQRDVAALEQRTCRALSDPAMLSWRPGQGCSASSPPFSLDQHLGHQLFRNQLLATSQVTTGKKEQQEVRWGLNAGGAESAQRRRQREGRAKGTPHLREGGRLAAPAASDSAVHTALPVN